MLSKSVFKNFIIALVVVFGAAIGIVITGQHGLADFLIVAVVNLQARFPVAAQFTIEQLLMSVASVSVSVAVPTRGMSAL